MSGPKVTLQELDDVLNRIAAFSPFSSPDLREETERKHCQPCSSSGDLLFSLFRRLNSSEAKWLVRMLSKNYLPARVPERLAMSRFHPFLYNLLRFQNSIPVAVSVLGRPNIRNKPLQAVVNPREEFRELLQPQVGVMIERPAYAKARSIRHCCHLAGPRLMSVERKYDGEYCQLHVDLGKPGACIKIFSKSGRDSTIDRIGLHRALRDSLELGTADCRIKKQCILEGELLVWNDDSEAIEPFHKIRNHIRRSGRLLGAAQDPPPNVNEHLMIMFYDLLLLDDTVCARESHVERRRLLHHLVRRIPGLAEVGFREVVAFSSANAAERLTEVFARAITQRWEGLVLKGCNDPYFTSDCGKSFIKLKKDYIPGLGDSADFTIIGGNHSAEDEQEIGIGKLWWTHGIPKDYMEYLNRHGYFTQIPFIESTPDFDVVLDPNRGLRPKALFQHPFIVEIEGAGFDKPANARYYTLRFPRVLKIHDDRSGKKVLAKKVARLSLSIDSVSLDIRDTSRGQRQQENGGRAVELLRPDNVSVDSSKRKMNSDNAWHDSAFGKRATFKPGRAIALLFWDSYIRKSSFGSEHLGLELHIVQTMARDVLRYLRAAHLSQAESYLRHVLKEQVQAAEMSLTLRLSTSSQFHPVSSLHLQLAIRLQDQVLDPSSRQQAENFLPSNATRFPERHVCPEQRVSPSDDHRRPLPLNDSLMLLHKYPSQSRMAIGKRITPPNVLGTLGLLANRRGPEFHLLAKPLPRSAQGLRILEIFLTTSCDSPPTATLNMPGDRGGDRDEIDWGSDLSGLLSQGDCDGSNITPTATSAAKLSPIIPDDNAAVPQKRTMQQSMQYNYAIMGFWGGFTFRRDVRSQLWEDQTRHAWPMSLSVQVRGKNGDIFDLQFHDGAWEGSDIRRERFSLDRRTIASVGSTQTNESTISVVS
ncbi:ATP dependent DNA ligase [Hirsutella rhossiliensis]